MMTSEAWGQLKTLFHSALELEPAARTVFLAEACAGDADLRKRVDQLLASNDNAGLFLVSPALVDAGVISSAQSGQDVDEQTRVGQRIGPYEIIRELGHGGMGTVFLAIRADDQYRKQVAIKLVNRGMDTDLILRRFMMERQILANLEHPNIARLLEGGSTPDGLPYFVMEYIEGQPITDYCDTRRFATTQRLELFQQICSALQYAHQNLVVHRDIKPSNILVTPEGVPKLLDFGIAKLLSPGWAAETGNATASMILLMTPEYASPEQFRGLPITTASDVYSLGVVLYELLSGHHPFRLATRRPDEVAQVVLREEPDKPSTAGRRQKAGGKQNGVADHEPRTNHKGLATSSANPQSVIRNPKSLKGDLDNIVLKALRKEPERRYASVQEFSEDIRRHLEGLPVIASPDTFSYRARKFVQRHKVGVLAAAVVVIALLAATAITTWQARVAGRERDKAEKRFNQVRKLANLVLFEYHDGIEKLPGSTAIREKMVKDALEYLDNLSAESGGDPTLQVELAEAYQKVGDVQGNPYGANLGNQDGALASYRKALTIREALYAANHADAKSKLELGHGYKRVADILWARGENEGALTSYRKALTNFSELVQADPKNLQYVNGVNVTLNGIGNAQLQSGDFKGALETFRNYLSNAKALLANDPTNKSNLRVLAVANLKVGDSLMGVSDYAGALTQYEKSVDSFSELAVSTPNDASAARLVGLGYGRVAMVYRRLKQYEKAASLNLKTLDTQKQVAAADSRNVQSQFDIATTYGNLSDNYLQMGRLDDAVTNVREAIKIFSETLATNPSYSQAQGNLGSTYLTYAEILLAKRDANGALENYRKALAILEPEPIRSAQIISLARAYQGLGNVQLLRADQSKGRTERQTECLKEAKDWYQRSLGVWRELDRKGKVTGDDKTTAHEITQKIDECDTALAKLLVAH
jgi:serine/threonine protein kinase/tetratricopeptide (TPR) repeat protein